MLHVPYGLQRELVGRAEPDGNGRPSFHDFPKAWAAFNIAGPLDQAVLDRSLRDAFASVDVFARLLPGRETPDDGAVEAPRHVRITADDTDSALNGFRRAITALVFDRSDLSSGARPFSLTVHTPDQTLLAMGADHAFLDGYSLSVLLRVVARNYHRHVRGDEPVTMPPALPLLASQFRDPADRPDLTDHFGACPRPASGLGLPGSPQLPPELWHAHDTHLFAVPLADSQILRSWCAHRSIPVSSAWRAIVQFTASVRSEEPVPVLYSRWGRTGAGSLRAIGPFYESTVARSESRFANGFDCWVEQASDPAVEAPPLLGSWLTDFVGQPALDLYRLVSLNYYPLPRAVRIGGAIATPAGRDLLAGLRPEHAQRLEKRNAIHTVVYRLHDGRFALQLMTDPRLAGPARDFGRALNCAVRILGTGASVDSARCSLADEWRRVRSSTS
jgi:hypothetical protein